MDRLDKSIEDIEINDNEEEYCTICTNNIKKYNNRELICGHIFHNKCIEDWFWSINKIAPICPYCMKECYPINKEYKGYKEDKIKKEEYTKKIKVYNSLGNEGYLYRTVEILTNRCCGETLKNDRCIRIGKKSLLDKKEGCWYYCNMHEKYSEYKEYDK
jgi:hypothetical protein